MKKISILALMLCILMILSSCSSGLEAVQKTVEEENPKESVSAEKEEKPEKKETKEEEIMQEYDPKEDDVMNVLMIGSSSCYYYVEELHGIAKAAGIDMKVCNVYYSGCSLEKHWTWWKRGESNYEFFVTDDNGRVKHPNYSLVQCLREENWDVISLQQTPVGLLHFDLEKAHQAADSYTKGLLDFLRQQFPRSRFVWHQTWAWDTHVDKSGLVITPDTLHIQQQQADFYKTFSKEMCEKFQLDRVPSGDAWQLVRHHPLIGDTLCERVNINDHFHDGDVGGGQYLNGCVWFEVLTGQSCIGNTWRPDDYQLKEEKIPLLQQAAHDAVAAMKAE